MSSVAVTIFPLKDEKESKIYPVIEYLWHPEGLSTGKKEVVSVGGVRVCEGGVVTQEGP